MGLKKVLGLKERVSNTSRVWKNDLQIHLELERTIFKYVLGLKERAWTMFQTWNNGLEWKSHTWNNLKEVASFKERAWKGDPYKGISNIKRNFGSHKGHGLKERAWTWSAKCCRLWERVRWFEGVKVERMSLLGS